MFLLIRSPVSGPSRSASIVSGVTPQSPSAYLMQSGAANYDNSARQAFYALLDTASEHYENKLLRIAGCLAEKVLIIRSTSITISSSEPKILT